MTKLPDSSSSFATFEVAILLRLRSDPLRNLWDQVEFEQLLREISESARLGAEGGCGWIGGPGLGLGTDISYGFGNEVVNQLIVNEDPT